MPNITDYTITIRSAPVTDMWNKPRQGNIGISLDFTGTEGEMGRFEVNQTKKNETFTMASRHVYHFKAPMPIDEVTAIRITWNSRSNDKRALYPILAQVESSKVVPFCSNQPSKGVRPGEQMIFGRFPFCP